MLFVDYVYDIIRNESKGFDAIYEDYIVKLIGRGGLTSLKVHGLVETCGTAYGRQLYVLCEKKGEINVV